MILGVSGKLGSGKDLFAQTLIELQPEKNWQVKKFAGKLKQIASLLTGVPVEKFEDPEFKKEFMPPEWDRVVEGYLGTKSVVRMTYREFLQKLGTDAMRDRLHTNVWINALFADYKKKTHESPRVNSTYSDYPNWIITDVRFPNEAQAVLDRGGKLIRIERLEFTDNHPSETALDDWKDWDLLLKNTGTIEDFKEIIQSIQTLI